jgi:hypothetical protein
MSVIQIPNYLDAIVQNHPELVVRAQGSAADYQSLLVEGAGALPTKELLDAEILQMKKDRMWLAIQDERTRRQNGGVFIASINKWFHSDQTSRIQQLGLVMMGAGLPTGIQWKTMDGSFIEMTPAIALSIFNAAATLDMTAFGVAEQHRVNMLASTAPETYNFSGFWPAIFTG